MERWEGWPSSVDGVEMSDSNDFLDSPDYSADKQCVETACIGLSLRCPGASSPGCPGRQSVGLASWGNKDDPSGSDSLSRFGDDGCCERLRGLPLALLPSVRSRLVVQHRALLRPGLWSRRRAGPRADRRLRVRPPVAARLPPGACRRVRLVRRAVRRGLCPALLRPADLALRPVPLRHVLRQRVRRAILGRLVRRSARPLRSLRQLRQFHARRLVQQLRSGKRERIRGRRPVARVRSRLRPMPEGRAGCPHATDAATCGAVVAAADF